MDLRESTLLPNVEKMIKILTDIEENLRSDNCTFNLLQDNVANNFQDIKDILLWALYEDGVGDTIAGLKAMKRLLEVDIYLEPSAE